MAEHHDPSADHRRTRAALAATAERLVQLLESTRESGARAVLPGWSVADVGAHVAAVFLAYCSSVSNEDTVDWDELLPTADLPFGPRMAVVNGRAVAMLGAQLDGDAAGFLAARTARFLRATADLAPDAPVATPWYGPRPALTVAAATGLLLSECLVHGRDIARATRRPWRIPPDHAALVLGQAMPIMMPLALDRTAARDVDLVLDLTVRGGPRLCLTFRDATLTVTRDTPPRTPDCRVSADPVAFLLVAFHRTPQWRAIALGHLRATGRRPWLATRLTRLIPSP
ncbi:maleylpyruvate isomerase family mycothiol-dependent enzyme [Kitasatospora sp. NPDC059646]|uniref:maleylpyruvate isomerase family mycothiol-dependent enzyme n=1 Tax=Kitasatospora sp. NPDC059646 TaxID=3346893 RepID=UPI0036A074B9